MVVLDGQCRAALEESRIVEVKSERRIQESVTVVKTTTLVSETVETGAASQGTVALKLFILSAVACGRFGAYCRLPATYFLLPVITLTLRFLVVTQDESQTVTQSDSQFVTQSESQVVTQSESHVVTQSESQVITQNESQIITRKQIVTEIEVQDGVVATSTLLTQVFLHFCAGLSSAASCLVFC